MKTLRICSLFLLVLLVFSACQKREAAIVISGTLENSFEKHIYLSKITPEGVVLLDSALINEGNFEFELMPSDELEIPTFYQIWLTPVNAFTTLAKSGDHLSFTADASQLVKTYSVEGPEDAQLMYQLDCQLREFVDTIEQLLAVRDANLYNDSVKLLVEEQYMSAVTQHTQFLRGFIQEHKTSLASITAFYQKFNRRIFLPEAENKALLDTIYHSLAPLYPESAEVEFIRRRLEIMD